MEYSARFRVKPRGHLKLATVNPADTADVLNKDQAEQLLHESVHKLADAQERLYAQDTWAVLAIFQAMDAAGKDGTVKHVLTGVNPRGCRIVSFGAPSKEELDHDYLWRAVKALPERGGLAIHNRSHYEEVIVTRIHPEVLEHQRLPDTTRGDGLIRRRFREINRFEKYLVDNGTVVLKFFLHVSKDEQWRRLSERMEDPEKFWKFQSHDLHERMRWDDYMKAYEDVFRYTSTAHAPWFVVPGDHKWFARLAVAEILNETLAKLNLQFPKVPESARAEWLKARDELLKAEGVTPTAPPRAPGA